MNENDSILCRVLHPNNPKNHYFTRVIIGISLLIQRINHPATCLGSNDGVLITRECILNGLSNMMLQAQKNRQSRFFYLVPRAGLEPARP